MTSNPPIPPVNAWVRSFVVLGALNGLLAVAFSAAGAHVLAPHLIETPEQLEEVLVRTRQRVSELLADGKQVRLS